ncbi:manganese-dependent inorganic pyrophosphatase [Candidatus Falkowbacteria bacterium]|nr:manganese-dependent inorganic pyrophosphatase [Candidatus Falkowbacteria bacterium]
MTYVIGHKSPDLDSVAAAVAYARFKNKMAGTDIYEPARAGELNKETHYLLEKAGIKTPKMPDSLDGEQVILVDHNENSQSLDGIEKAEIVEILDHHKMNFSYDQPIEITVKPWGASCSIIAHKFFENNIDIDKGLALLMLGAVLVDTVITKSPTSTDMDKQMIEKLSEIAEIADWHEFGMEIFKVRSSLEGLAISKIIENDAKEFDLKSGKFFINQLETADLESVKEKESEIMEEMKKLKDEKSYHTVITFITDIINEGSKFLVATDDKEKMEKALGKSLDEDVYLEGVMSRKKQVIPMLSEIFDK